MEHTKTYRIGTDLEGPEYDNFMNSIKFIPKVGNIAPQLLSYELHKKPTQNWKATITTEKFINSRNLDYATLVKKNQTQFIKLVQTKVARLHQLDICHGDLHLGNIVLAGNLEENTLTDVFLIDWDTAFHISTGKTEPRVIRWRSAYDFDTYEQFVEHDFHNFVEELEYFVESG